LVSIHGPTEGERRSRPAWWRFCGSSSIIAATILIIKNNLSNKARFNLNNRNYFMNARKTHINTRRRYWALGLGPTPRAIAPLERSVLVQS